MRYVKRVAISSSLLFTYMIYGLLIGQFQLGLIQYKIRPNPINGYYDYKGVTHVHPISDSVQQLELISAAKESDLDFVLLARHNSFDDKLPREQYFGDLLFIEAGSYSYVDNHLLYYNDEAKSEFDSIGQSQLYFADLINSRNEKSANDFLVLAQPFASNILGGTPNLKGYDGLELINLKSMWESSWERHKFSALWSFFVYPFNPQLAFYRLFELPEKEFELWDQANTNQKMIGHLGNEAQSRVIPLGPLGNQQFPSHKTFFQLATAHLLLKSEFTGNPTRDRQKVFEALRAGSFYMSFEMLANPKGFYAEMSSRGEKFSMGSSISLTRNLKLKIVLPSEPTCPYEIAIFKDGQLFLTANSPETTIDIHTPGVYRAVVRVIPTLPLPDGKKWLPWIVSNPFFVQKVKASSTL